MILHRAPNQAGLVISPQILLIHINMYTGNTYSEVFAPNVKPLDIVQCQTLGQSDCQVFVPVPSQWVGSAAGEKKKQEQIGFLTRVKRCADW